jgi:hypothetical protein
MGSVRVLAAWTWRRLRRRAHRLRLFLSITIDWVVFLYIVLPGAALLAWLLFRYEHASIWWPWLAGAAARMHLPAVWLAGLITVLALYIPHSVWYGKAAIPLEPADALFWRVSPLSRRAIFCTLWAETFAFTLPGTLAAWVLTAPLARATGMSLATWAGWACGWVLYETSVRLLSHAFQPRGIASWRRRILLGSGRYLSYAGLAWSARWLFTPGGLGRITVLGLWWVAGLLLAAAVLYFLPRTDWDALFGARGASWLARWFPQDDDRPLRVRYFFRRFPRRVVRVLDSLIPGCLGPAEWLLVVRGLRRPGLVRDVVYISAVAVGATRGAPAVMKWLSMLFLAVLLGEWWSLSVAPLYRSPIQHQTVVDPWRLERRLARWRWGFVALVFALWVVLAMVI